jgi:hypothetical protein
LEKIRRIEGNLVCLLKFEMKLNLSCSREVSEQDVCLRMSGEGIERALN